MLPGEIFAAMRARGAQMVQVNHPRGSGFTEFQAAWSRANVKYDYDNRTIFGDYEDASVPNDWLRLPGESLWSDQFNGARGVERLRRWPTRTATACARTSRSTA